MNCDGTFGFSISLVSSIGDSETEAKFDSLRGPPAIRPVICDCSTKVELASRLGISESAVRKLTNPDHRSL